MAKLIVRHNIEVAHRLSLLPGKCENIHGHSMWVQMELYGWIDEKGLINGQDFGSVKKAFRGYLDSMYDHHLLLNKDDPWAQDLDPEQRYDGSTEPKLLPGLATFPGDPTTENLAKWISAWAVNEFETDATVRVDETHVNAAEYHSSHRHSFKDQH